MTDAKIVLTLKGGTGYDEPWVVIHADTVDEASALLKEVNDKGVFSGMKAAASVFHAAPTAEGQAVSAVVGTFPGSTVTPPAAPAAPAPTSSVDPRCPDCGSAMTYKTGSSARGPWQGWFCQNKPRDAKGHVIWI